MSREEADLHLNMQTGNTVQGAEGIDEAYEIISAGERSQHSHLQRTDGNRNQHAILIPEDFE